MVKNVNMHFEFKNIIPTPPVESKEMYSQACANDKVTVDSWLPQWVANAKHTKERFGSYAEHGLGKLYNINNQKPCIVVGSGPSLKNNIEDLKNAKGFTIISCLHNYHYMVDNNVPVDYYVSLDAGPVVIEEISEGGKETPEFYKDSTKNAKLIAFIGSHPTLWDTWQGEIHLFNSPIPSEEYRERVKEIEEFHTYVSTGGNVLGGATYIAKAIFGSSALIFLGADFSFSYERKFHAWDSKYDGKMGTAIRAIDVWGNGVLTWQSYYNFKVWFDWLSNNVPGIYINCTEGGLMGSYPEGNLASIRQMKLKDCLDMFTMHRHMEDQCKDPTKEDKKILF